MSSSLRSARQNFPRGQQRSTKSGVLPDRVGEYLLNGGAMEAEAMRLEGKTALVTGGGAGIREATRLGPAREAAVAVADLSLYITGQTIYSDGGATGKW